MRGLRNAQAGCWVGRQLNAVSSLVEQVNAKLVNGEISVAVAGRIMMRICLKRDVAVSNGWPMLGSGRSVEVTEMSLAARVTQVTISVTSSPSHPRQASQRQTDVDVVFLNMIH